MKMRKEELNQNTLQTPVGTAWYATQKAITLISLAISRKCVRYEERAWKPCERREKERKV